MNIADLEAYGANVKEGVTRCVGNEEFYLRLVGRIKDDPSFEQLEAAIGKGDLDEAFEAAHALKGSLGNLALTLLYKPVSQMTELLRSRTEMDYAPFLETIAEQKAKLCAL